MLQDGDQWTEDMDTKALVRKQGDVASLGKLNQSTATSLPFDVRDPIASLNLLALDTDLLAETIVADNLNHDAK
jgi:hypothetical protein